MSDGLTRVRIEGLGSISSVELDPGRLTVLIGSNGSGKSNVLRALRLAPLLRTKSLQRFVGEAGGASALLHYGPRRTQVLRLELEFEVGGGGSRYSARLGYAAGDKLLFLDESVGYRRRPDAPWTDSGLGAGHWESVLEDSGQANKTARSVGWWLGRLTFFHFHDTSMTSALRTNARAEDDRYLRSDGSNLAAYLLRLRESEREDDHAAWRRINHLIQRVAPCVKELRPTPTAERGSSVRLDWIDDQDEVFGSHQLSDGTLRAIALITVLAQPTDRLPKFISIDEPELGLHPSAIALLADLARSVSDHCQILFATQSTAFLDHFDPADVVVVERERGATKLHRPNVADLRVWLENYSLSEVFDKGVIGGRP